MILFHCLLFCFLLLFVFFFFNDTATTEIYTLSLHDALPISEPRLFIETTCAMPDRSVASCAPRPVAQQATLRSDRKSTRLNSSHTVISYAVFCLKKKNKIGTDDRYDIDRIANQNAIKNQHRE